MNLPDKIKIKSITDFLQEIGLDPNVIAAFTVSGGITREGSFITVEYETYNNQLYKFQVPSYK